MLGSAGLCSAILEGGQRCRATPMRESTMCFFRNPETQDEAKEARRLGGMRRRREGAVAGAYEFDGLATSNHLRRLLEIAATDALALENSIARVRALTTIAQVGAAARSRGAAGTARCTRGDAATAHRAEPQVSLGRRLGRLEDAEQDEVARAMAREEGIPFDDARRQLDLWDRLIVVHGLVVGERVELERIRAFLTDFAVRLGDEDPERYARETLAEWAAEDASGAVGDAG